MRRSWLLLLCLAAVGCAPPYFEALNAAAGLTRQMTNVGTVGSVSLDSTAADVRFLPPRPTASSIADVSVRSGFVVRTRSAYQYLAYTWLGSEGRAQSIDGPAFEVSSLDPNFPQYEYVVTSAAGTPSIIVFLYSPSPLQSTFQEYVPNETSFTMTTPLSAAPVYLNSLFTVPPQHAIGGAIFPNPAPAPDQILLLITDGTVFSEGITDLDGTSVIMTTNGTQSLATVPVPAVAQSRSLTFYNPNTAQGYASYVLSGAWQTVSYSSPSGTPSVLAGVTHPLTAVLTTGDLLSTDGGILRLYDPSGNMLRTMALNGLQFCYEAYVGSTPYVFFSLPLHNSRSDWSFNVYAIPTSSMRSLSG